MKVWILRHSHASPYGDYLVGAFASEKGAERAQQTYIEEQKKLKHNYGPIWGYSGPDNDDFYCQEVELED